jgi:outer membrane protein
MRHLYGLLVLTLMGLTLISADCRAGEWGLGLGVAVQRPPQKGTDTQVVALPFPSYEGDRLSLNFGSIAYSLTNSERFRFAVEGQLRFDGYDPDASEALAGLEERDLTLDAGFSFTASDAWGIATFKVMGDALGVHEGYEISASYQYPMQFKRWTLVPSIGLNLPSAELVEYYYGVKPNEATDDRPAYSGKSVVNATVGLNAMYKLASHWEIIGGAEYTLLGDGITDSPIIAEDSEVIAYSALVYRF